MSKEEQRWFFIIGCQRSGTTLLRLILECHSHVECYDEFHAYSMLSTREIPVRSLPLLGLKVPVLTEQLGNPRLYAMFRWFPNRYDGQRLIFAVRDVRAVVASMIKLHVNGRPWLETFAVPWLKYRARNDKAFQVAYQEPLNSLRDANFPRLAVAAIYWRSKVDAYFEYIERRFPLLVLRYEDLVKDPKLELLRTCSFLGVPWEPSLLEHPKMRHAELREDGMAIGNTDPRRPIDTLSKDRWRECFGKAELSEILYFSGRAQELFYGYEQR